MERELSDDLTNADREAKAGRFRDSLSLLLRVLTVLVSEVGQVKERLKQLEAEVERTRDPW